jgi:radical SAM superfamily enzyme YgiQ (UPF0313 family)
MIDILFIDGTDDKMTLSYSSFLCYLFPCASLLEKHGYSFKILNVSFLDDYSYNGILMELQRLQFRCVGFTTTADNYYNVKNLVNQIKRQYPDIPIILGGPQASYNEDFIFDDSECDIIIRHEGDYKLIQLLDFYVRHKGSLQNVEGISYRTPNKIIKNKDPQKYIDLNTLPTPQYAIISDPKYWIFPINKTKKEIEILLNHIKRSNSVFITSRGCPYNCIFCVEGSLSRSYRERNLDLVMQDLEYFLRITKVSNLAIADSTFTSSPQRVKEFCERIEELRKKYKFKWYAEGRANILAKNPELIDIMHNAGLWHLQIGIESGSDEMLKKQNKRITLGDIRIVAQKVAQYNDLRLNGNIMLGNSGETKETFKESVEFAKELHQLSNFNIDLNYGYLVPYVGTPIRNYPEKYGIDILVENFENKKLSGYIYPLCKPKDLDIEELENLSASFRGELTSFFIQSIFKMDKKDIDKKMAFHIQCKKKFHHPYPRSFETIFMYYDSLRKYYKLFFRKAVVKDFTKIKEKPNLFYPVRLWDILWHPEKKYYYFTSLKGEKIIIKDYDYFLWEMASGINTIADIISYSNIVYKSLNCEYILNFYINLYDNYALLFRE